MAYRDHKSEPLPREDYMKKLILALFLSLTTTQAFSSASMASNSQLYNELAINHGHSALTYEMEQALDYGSRTNSHAVLFCFRANIGLFVVGVEGLVCEVLDLRTFKSDVLLGLITNAGPQVGLRDLTVMDAFREYVKNKVTHGGMGLFVPTLSVGMSVGYVRGNDYKSSHSLVAKDGRALFGVNVRVAAGWGGGAEWYTMLNTKNSKDSTDVSLGFVSGYFGDAITVGGSRLLFERAEVVYNSVKDSLKK